MKKQPGIQAKHPEQKKLSAAARNKALKEGVGKVTLQNRKMDVIFISNRVTNAAYNYTLFEEKILNYLLFGLQQAVRANMNGNNHRQLDLFANSKDYISLEIPMNEITKPDQYRELRAAVVNMGKTEVHIYRHTEKLHKTIYLFRGTSTWSADERSNTMIVDITHEVADLLIEVDKNRMGKPMHYTSFFLEVANSFSNKYGSRIYKLISGWKEKGGFYISMDDMRKKLGLENKYPRYSDFKKNVLLPVQHELESDKQDCWYDCTDPGFEVKEGRNVTGLNFKVITPAYEEHRQRKIEHFKALFIEHFGFRAKHLSAMEPVFANRTLDFDWMLKETFRLKDYCHEKRSKIKDRAAYVQETLLRIFSEVPGKRGKEPADAT